MNARKLLLVVTFVFAVTEAIDIVDVGIAAAIFAALYVLFGAWFWRRGSVIAVAVLGFAFLVEVTQAHTWKDTSTAVKIYAMVLGAIGLVAAAGVVVGRVRSRRIAAHRVA